MNPRPKAQGNLFPAPSHKPATTNRRPSTFRSAIAARRSTSATEPHRLNSKKLWLSATAIETMKRCPRCFWLEKKEGIRQPEGIVSRLANRFDAVIKQYFDLYRPNGQLPPMIEGRVEGKLQYPFQEKYWYHIDDQYGFYGKLDECLVSAAGTYTPVDHKTASSDPATRELIPAYQFQLDSYAFLLEKNARPTTGLGHLIYFFPDHGPKLHDGFPMQVTIKTLKTNPDRVMPELQRAIGLLDGPLPRPNETCVFCAYVERVKKF